MTGGSFVSVGTALRREVMNLEKVRGTALTSVLSVLSGGSSDGDRYDLLFRVR